jgi:hypothetical protein
MEGLDKGGQGLTLGCCTIEEEEEEEEEHCTFNNETLLCSKVSPIAITDVT